MFNDVGPSFPSPSSHSPEWLKDSNIYILEIFATCLSAFHLACLNGTGPSIFFIDNDAALSAMIRGTSDDEAARILITIFWRICSDKKITPWLERVCSKNNPADDPSRGRVGAGTSCHRFEFPHCPFLENEEKARRYALWT